jgi:hypothetical protein
LISSVAGFIFAAFNVVCCALLALAALWSAKGHESLTRQYLELRDVVTQHATQNKEGFWRQWRYIVLLVVIMALLEVPYLIEVFNDGNAGKILAYCIAVSVLIGLQTQYRSNFVIYSYVYILHSQKNWRVNWAFFSHAK